MGRLIRKKLSWHKMPIPYRKCQELLDLLGVPKDYQEQFIVRTKDGWTVRLQAAGEWVLYFIWLWQNHIKKLEQAFAANGNWPPKNIKVGFERLILAGLTNEEAHAILDPIFDIGGPRRPNQACYYRFHLARRGLLRPELMPDRHPNKTGCKGGKRTVTK